MVVAVAEPVVRTGTWADPQMYPFAVARLDDQSYVRFELHHERHTARVVSTFPQEARGGTITDGVHSQIEPFINAYDVAMLPMFSLRLMAYPFNATTVYRIEAA